MMKMIKKLEELAGIFETRLKKIDAEKSELAGLRATLNSQKEELDEYKNNLQIREAQVKEQELIVKTIKEANQILANASEKKNRIRTLQDELDTAKAAHAQKIIDDQVETDRQREKVAKQSIEIDIKAADYKKKVLEEISKQTGKQE